MDVLGESSREPDDSFKAIEQHILSERLPLTPDYETDLTVERALGAGDVDQALSLLSAINEHKSRSKTLALEANLLMDRLEIHKAEQVVQSAQCRGNAIIESSERLNSFGALVNATAASEEHASNTSQQITNAIRQYLPSPPLAQDPASAPKVALVSAFLGRGGLPVQLTRLAILLSCSGFQVRVFHGNQQRPNPALLTQLHKAGITVSEWLDQQTHSSIAMLDTDIVRAFDLPETVVGLAGRLNRWNPDIVHAMGAPRVLSSVGLAAARCNVPKIVLSARSLSPNDRPDSAVYRRTQILDKLIMSELLARTGTKFVANSKAGWESYSIWLDSIGKEPAVTPNIVELGHLKSRSKRRIVQPWPRDAIVVGGAFRLAKEKRPSLWLKIALEVSKTRPDIHFAICGEGRLSKADAAEASKLTNFHLLGYRNPLAPWIASFDTLLLTSLSEGLPNVCLEAQALGIPVVTSDVGGSGETFINGITGFLVDEPSDARVYANAILKSLDHEWRGRCFRESTAYVQRCFGAEAQIATLSPFYGVSPKDHVVNHKKWMDSAAYG